MKKLFITLIFLFTLLPHGYILADEKTITISGRVQNKTENSDSSKEYIIKLFKIINNSEEIIEISNTKTNQYQFSFSNLTITDTDEYFLVTENEGLSVITELNLQQQWDNLIIEIYDKGTNLDDIKISEYSLMIIPLT